MFFLLIKMKKTDINRINENLFPKFETNTGFIEKNYYKR